MELIIGPRAYSTWSLRGWLVMRMTGADFAVIDARYDTPEHKAALEALSPSGFVPALRVGGRGDLGHAGHRRMGGRNLSRGGAVADRPRGARPGPVRFGGNAFGVFGP